MKIRVATLGDKPAIIAIAKQSVYTKGVSNPMFMSDDSFARNEVAVAYKSDGMMIGFVVVRHLVRKPHTSLYYVGVHEQFRSHGIGERLVRWALRTSPWQKVRLICEQTNVRAHSFYERIGFRRTGEGANKSGEPYYVFEATLRSYRKAVRSER